MCGMLSVLTRLKSFARLLFFFFLNHQNQMIVSIVRARLEVNTILLCQRALLCENLNDEVQSAESFDSRNSGGQSGECAPRRLLFHTDLALLQCHPPAPTCGRFFHFSLFRVLPLPPPHLRLHSARH